MKKLLLTITIVICLAATGFAQLGDILRKVDPNKIKKGVSAARTVTKEFTEEEEKNIGRIVAARVLDTPVVNAFSAPYGYIFITTGALEQIHSEAELAGVLGHEIAHATEKHILREIKRANVISEGLNLAEEQFGKGGLSDDLARRVGDLAIEKLFKTGLGRKEELDADRIGAELAGAAGYRQSCYLDFLKSLDQLEDRKSDAMRQLVSTHPKPEERIKSLSPRIKDASGGQLLADRWERWTALQLQRR